MTSLKSIETKLNDIFKGLPAMPDSGKESLVKAWPYIALIFGILQLIAAWSLWRLTSYAERLSNLVALYTATNPLSSYDKTIIYLGVIMLVVDAVILLMAYPHLVTRSRKGWDLLFLAALVNVGGGVVQIFINGRGFGSFIFGLLGSAVGFYLLFQVRAKYSKGSAASS